MKQLAKRIAPDVLRVGRQTTHPCEPHFMAVSQLKLARAWRIACLCCNNDYGLDGLMEVEMKLGQLLKQVLPVCGCLFVLTGPAMADPIADAAHAYRAGDYAKAEKLLIPLARHGDARAQSVLGHLFYDGKGVPRDYKKAAKWFHLAATQGEAQAQYALGTM